MAHWNNQNQRNRPSSLSLPKQSVNGQRMSSASTYSETNGPVSVDNTDPADLIKLYRQKNTTSHIFDGIMSPMDDNPRQLRTRKFVNGYHSNQHTPNTPNNPNRPYGNGTIAEEPFRGNDQMVVVGTQINGKKIPIVIDDVDNAEKDRPLIMVDSSPSPSTSSPSTSISGSSRRSSVTNSSVMTNSGLTDRESYGIGAYRQRSNIPPGGFCSDIWKFS